MINDRTPKLYLSRSHLLGLLAHAGNVRDDKYAHEVYLSERNVNTLLSKLERDAAGEQTACMIIKHQQPKGTPFNQTFLQLAVIGVQDDDWDPVGYMYSMFTVNVYCIKDEEYYGSQGRPAGEMVHQEESKLYKPSTGVQFAGPIF